MSITGLPPARPLRSLVRRPPSHTRWESRGTKSRQRFLRPTIAHIRARLDRPRIPFRRSTIVDRIRQRLEADTAARPASWPTSPASPSDLMHPPSCQAGFAFRLRTANFEILTQFILPVYSNQTIRPFTACNPFFCANNSSNFFTHRRALNLYNSNEDRSRIDLASGVVTPSMPFMLTSTEDKICPVANKEFFDAGAQALAIT